MSKRKPILPLGMSRPPATRTSASQPGKTMHPQLKDALDRLAERESALAYAEQTLRFARGKLPPASLAEGEAALIALRESVALERAHIECQRHRDIYEKFHADIAGFNLYTLRLFSRDEFAPLHFGQDVIQEIIERQGPPPVAERIEQRAEYIRRAVPLSAPPDRRRELATRLLRYAPRLVRAKRIREAWAVFLMAASTLEDVDEINPFLGCMIDGGLVAWEQAQIAQAEAIIGELGLPLDQAPRRDSPEYPIWLRAHLDTPEVRAQLNRLLPQHPAAIEAAERVWESGIQGALVLLERGDLYEVLLEPDEIIPVLARMPDRSEELAARWRAAGEQERAAVQAEISEMLVNAICEALPELWTPARRADLEAKLARFIARMADRGDVAAHYAQMALESLKLYDDPADNVFLIGWVMRSIQKVAELRINP